MSDPITLRLDLNIRQDIESFQDLFVHRIQEAFDISEWGKVTSDELITHEGSDEPLMATIAMEVPSLHDKQLTGLITLCEQFGAPAGSTLTVHHDDESVHAMGKFHGLAIYLDGVNLDKKIYKKYDVDSIWDAVNNELGDEGMACGFWHGHTETAIYAYGEDVEAMRANLAGLLSKHPLCRGARVVVLPDTLPEIA